MSEARKRILVMLAEGKITVDQSEELLAALEKDEKAQVEARTEQQSGDRQKPPSVKEEISRFAENVQKHFREAVKKCEPPSRELKARIKEFGGWMQNVVGSVVQDFSNGRHEPSDGVPVQFTIGDIPELAGISSARLENLFGSLNIREGSSIEMRVSGRISKSAMESQEPRDWFRDHFMKIEGDRLLLGIDRSAPSKVVLDIELFLPASIVLQVKTVSASVSVKGPFRIDAIQTISGDIRLLDASLSGTDFETVSGDLNMEKGKLAAEYKSTSGDVLLKTVSIEKLGFQSISGDILVTEPEIGDDTTVEIATTSGDISVEKLSGPWSRIEASSRTGNLDIKWEGTVNPTGRNGKVVESGNRGATFRVESVSGDIVFD